MIGIRRDTTEAERLIRGVADALAERYGSNQSWPASLYEALRLLRSEGREPDALELWRDVGPPVRWADVEPGSFFRIGETVGLMTEYGCDAYIVGSGETFSAGESLLRKRMRLVVQPVLPGTPSDSPAEERERGTPHSSRSATDRRSA